ncbi:FxLYD domain-containing protein [Chromobacterium sp. ASV23]|uniref:FxLYD domain-containing protein n=1 Tax=Chromobacterium sp. ASV23 TaxID=2795110 RepID=UPI0018EBD80A|nr:FxLYD domain-containing protein [Chromobacterium sp. ASV23]
MRRQTENMTRRRPARRFMVLALCASMMGVAAAPAQAEAKPHLLFHMGVGANGQFVVKGTIQNQGDQPVDHGYVVVSMRDAACHPLGDRLQAFGPVAPGQKLGFEVPVDGKLAGYRLTAFKAFDDMGFELPASDDTSRIIQAREAEERKACSLARDGRNH